MMALAMTATKLIASLVFLSLASAFAVAVGRTIGTLSGLAR